jgi:hypothetical protein
MAAQGRYHDNPGAARPEHLARAVEERCHVDLEDPRAAAGDLRHPQRARVEALPRARTVAMAYAVSETVSIWATLLAERARVLASWSATSNRACGGWRLRR